MGSSLFGNAGLLKLPFVLDGLCTNILFSAHFNLFSPLISSTLSYITTPCDKSHIYFLKMSTQLPLKITLWYQKCAAIHILELNLRHDLTNSILPQIGPSLLIKLRTRERTKVFNSVHRLCVITQLLFANIFHVTTFRNQKRLFKTVRSSFRQSFVIFWDPLLLPIVSSQFCLPVTCFYVVFQERQKIAQFLCLDKFSFKNLFLCEPQPEWQPERRFC